MRCFLFLFATTALGEQSSFELGVNSLRDDLSLTVMNGNTKSSGLASTQKKMAEALLSKVGIEMSPETLKILEEQVIPLLEQILDNLREAKSEADVSLNVSREEIVQCRLADSWATDQVFIEQYEQGSQNFQDKRAVEEAAAIDRKASCTTFASKVEGWRDEFSEECAKGPTAIDEIAEITFLGHILTTVVQTVEQQIAWYPLEENKLHDCFDSHNEWKTAKAASKLAQRDMELDACAIRDHRAMTCAGEDTCYADMTAAYAAASDAEKLVSEQRVEDAKSVNFILCGVRYLITDPANFTGIDSIKNNNAVNCPELDDTSYATNIQDAPDQPACALWTDYPGTQSWYQRESAALVAANKEVANYPWQCFETICCGADPDECPLAGRKLCSA